MVEQCWNSHGERENYRYSAYEYSRRLRNCVCFLMVEHLWIRLADIKEEAADEEWRASHPRLARWRKSYRYWRAQV